MPSEVILPRVDMDMASGKISKWLVGDGTRVKKGQPLFEIETDKAAMEIEAEASGTIRTLTHAGADDVAVGSVVAWIYGEGEPETGAAPPSGVGELRVETFPAVTASRSIPQVGEIRPEFVTDRLRATPLARRLARERGLELRGLQGTGPRGRVQAADVPRSPRDQPTVTAQLERPQSARVVGLEAHAVSAPVESVPASQRRAASADALGLALAPVAASRLAVGPLETLRDGEGTPIVLIHGFGSDASAWRPFLNGYGAGRPVLALDLPGHGAAPLGAVTDFPSLVDAVEEDLLASGLRALDLVGHSLGGAVAAAVAARGSLNLRSVLLVVPAGLGPEINGAFVNGYLGATCEASLAPWMRELVAAPEFITPAFVRATLKARKTALATQRRLAASVFPDGTQAFSIRADLGRIGCPVRVVVGTADRIIPARHADGLPPLVALHRLAGIGHMPQIEDRATLQAILAQTVGA